MKISQYKFLAIVAVLFVFVQQAQQLSLEELSKLEKIVVNPEFQEMQEALINASTDADSLAVTAVIEDIRNTVRTYLVHELSPLAVNTAIEGILEAIRLVNSVVRQANKAIDVAFNLVKADDKKGATDAIKKGLKADRDLIFIAGVPIHDAQGFALSLVGGLALPELKNTMISIQTAGVSILECLDVADQIATDGINTGGPAAYKALNAARKIVLTGSLSVYNHLKEAAAHALEGLQYAVSRSGYEVDVLPGVIFSLKTTISTDNPAALGATAMINNSLNSVLNVVTNKTEIDAVNIIYEGLRSTIIETADAMLTAKNGFEEAGKLASQDPEAAVDAVRKAIKTAERKLFSASAYGYLALGAAGQVSGNAVADELVATVIEMEYGRATAYEDLELAARISIVGILGGNSATQLGINTALQMCDAAGIALFQDFVDAGEMGFKVFRKAHDINSV